MSKLPEAPQHRPPSDPPPSVEPDHPVSEPEMPIMPPLPGQLPQPNVPAKEEPDISG